MVAAARKGEVRRVTIDRKEAPGKALLTVLLLVLSLVSVLPGPSAAEAPGPYADWSLDEDGNGVHDALDEDLADGATGTVVVEAHYDRRPTAADVALLEEDHGVIHTYRYRNWDDILLRIHYDDVPGLLSAPGVVAVEKMPKGHLDLGDSVPAIRAASADLTDDGLDHRLSVHDTLGYRGEGTVIAILDTGIDNSHESLDDLDDDPTTVDPKVVTRTDPTQGALVAGAEVSNMLHAVGCVDPTDSVFHGTHVAGIAAGTAGSHDAPGVAPRAQLVDVAISGLRIGGTDGIPVGLDWILSFNKGETCFGDPGEDRIDVVSMSLSLTTNDPDASINRKITDLARSGMVFVASAGNDGPDVDTITKGPEGGIIAAAAYDDGSVGRSDDRLDDYSSRGPRPSDGDDDDLDELRPDVAAPGTRISAPLVYSRALRWSLSGTSMAAPHVAGVSALILQADPGLAPVDAGSNDAMGDAGSVPVRDLLQQTAQYKTATVGPDPQLEQTGRFGLPWNNAWGYGLVDAYAAVSAAEGG